MDLAARTRPILASNAQTAKDPLSAWRSPRALRRAFTLVRVSLASPDSAALSYAATTSSTATVDEASATMSPSSVCLVWRPSSEMT